MFHCTPSASTKLGQCNLFPHVQLTLKSGALRSWNGSWTCRVGQSRRSGARVARISGGTDPSPFPTSSGSSARAAPAPASPPATRPARFRRSRRSLETRRLAPGPTSIRRREGPSPPSRPAASENEILTVHDLHAPSGPQLRSLPPRCVVHTRRVTRQQFLALPDARLRSRERAPSRRHTRSPPFHELGPARGDLGQHADPAGSRTGISSTGEGPAVRAGATKRAEIQGPAHTGSGPMARLNPRQGRPWPL